MAGHELVGVRGSTQILIIKTAFTSIHRVYRRRSRADNLPDGDGTEERGVVQPLRYSDSTHIDNTGDNCSTCTGSREEERQTPARSRGRARGIQAESGPSEPILSDDDAETSDFEEGASQHSESSESEDDDAEEGTGAKSGDDAGSGSGSDSDNDADRDSAPESSPLRKRTKRASRA
ncbi:uncharacterized protein LOC114279273 [Camellia sinensis]|uniref:uncharacterized protein LOC114279273 n=1 Tax=Camellia sinensis TaxID=4442 RepID=UPI001036D3BD|nr:uncharacterized protein LOC114279273 [Camellia sinensis]